MSRRVKVQLFGRQNRSISIDPDASSTVVLGKNIVWPDGTLVQPTQIINSTTPPQEAQVKPTLWELILNIPAIIKSLAALTDAGIVHHDGAGGISAHYWPVVKNSIETGKVFTIPSGHQLLVYDEFLFDGGELIIDGDLVIL